MAAAGGQGFLSFWRQGEEVCGHTFLSEGCYPLLSNLQACYLTSTIHSKAPLHQTAVTNSYRVLIDNMDVQMIVLAFRLDAPLLCCPVNL